MEKPISIEREQQKLKEGIEHLSQTEGYPNLTERQKKLLKQSLYVQARSERDPRDYAGQYRTSLKHAQCWNCFYSVANLEAEKGLDIERGEVARDFFKAEYKEIKNIKELRKLVEMEEFPCVLLIGDDEYEDDGEPDARHMHACLVLGHDSEGNIVVWEKEGIGGPYNVTTLEKVYNYYSNYPVDWGVRKLSSNQQKDIEQSGT